MPWIHRDDEVGIILWALGDGAHRRVAELDGAESGQQPRVLEDARQGPAPARDRPRPRLALVAIRGEELTEQIVASLPRGPAPGAQDLGYEFRFAELEPALRDLARVAVAAGPSKAPVPAGTGAPGIRNSGARRR